MKELGTWLVSLAGPAIRKVLISLGVGVVSYGGLMLLVNSVRDHVIGALGGLSGAAYQIIAMSGAFEAVSILLGGLTARATLMAVEKLGRMNSPASS